MQPSKNITIVLIANDIINRSNSDKQ